MYLKLNGCPEALAAELTLVCPLSNVSLHVLPKSGLMCKTSLTETAFQRLGSGMDSSVDFEAVPILESFPTGFTREGIRAVVSLKMALKVNRCLVLLFALIAFKWSL
jgi:hypothetical protein